MDPTELLDAGLVQELSGRTGPVSVEKDSIGQALWSVADDLMLALFVQELPTPADARQVVELERRSKPDGQDPGDVGDAALLYRSNGFLGLVLQAGEVVATLTPLAPELTADDVAELGRDVVRRLHPA